ncbi:ABC transporter permease [Stenotrophomonas sp. NA06056]|uniref:ABC transporter permease n=1 Tax=Stenotrophomonas sp. NA06056 TaxID=2742129 RepID=UPI00158D777A|nr:ABC transporter permease [Stenotrophomonas sp. NA06056]QKW58723.1 ABC transporter permease [Stenotrophomonas sp. NA06056]
MLDSMREVRSHLGRASLLFVQAALASLACAFALQSAVGGFSRLNTRGIEGAETIGVIRVSDIEEGAAPSMVRSDLSTIQFPGVRQAVASDSVPFGGRAHHYGACTSDAAMAHAMAAGSSDVAGCDRIPVVTASPGLLTMLGARIVMGRLPADHEASDSAPVVLISEALADHLFGVESAVGRQLYFGPGSSRVIVGVFSSIVGPAPGGNDRDSQWALFPGFPSGTSRYYLTRSHSEVDRVLLDRTVEALQRPYRVVIPTGVDTLAGYRDAYLRADRFTTSMLAFMAAVVLGVLMAGVYGVVGAWLERRRRSIGIRRTLGARGSVILAEIIFEVGIFTVPGAVLGACSLHLLWSPQDEVASSPWLAGLVAFMLVMAASLAALLPSAWRTVREEPLALLKPF